MQIPVFTFSVHPHLFILCQQIISIFQLIRTSEKYFPKLSTLSAVFHVPQSVKAASFWASLVSSMHLCTSQKCPGILDNSTSKGERNKPVSHSLSCLKWSRMDAIWRSRSLRSSSRMVKLGLFLAPPILISKSVNILQLQWHRSALICPLMKYSKRVQDLQGGVDVDKDNDYQVENGPNDAQHGQDALLRTFLVLDSLFLITVESVYHFPWKSLQFSSQTNLERADKREKRKTQSVC